MQTNKLITYSSQIQKIFLNLLSSVIFLRCVTIRSGGLYCY